MDPLRKVAFVTCGAIGSGRDITLALARAGFDLVIHHHDAPTPAREAARRVEAVGRRALVVEGDLREEAAVGEMVRRIRTRFGRLDALVNCPGPGSAAGLWEGPGTGDQPAPGPDPYQSLLEDLEGPYRIVGAAAALLGESGGSVVNVLDGGGTDSFTTEGWVHLTRGFARAMAPRVRVNAVAIRRGAGQGGSTRSTPLVAMAPDSGEVVRAVLFVLGSPHLVGEVIRAGEDLPGDGAP